MGTTTRLPAALDPSAPSANQVQLHNTKLEIHCFESTLFFTLHVESKIRWLDGDENSSTTQPFLLAKLNERVLFMGKLHRLIRAHFYFSQPRLFFFLFFLFFFFSFLSFFFSNPQGFDNIMVLWVRDRAVCLFVTKSFVKQIFQLILQIKPGSVGIFVMAPGTFALGAS